MTKPLSVFARISSFCLVLFLGLVCQLMATNNGNFSNNDTAIGICGESLGNCFAFRSPASFDLEQFISLMAAPTATTNSTTNRTGTSATLNGAGNPNGETATGWFRYSTTSPGTCNDTFGTRAPSAGGSALGSGTSGVSYLQNISGLTAGSTYFYCAIVQNASGTAFGTVSIFTTPTPPTATTSSATNVVDVSATLNGSGNPNGAATTGWFRYAATSPGTCNDTFGSRAPTSGGSSLGTGTSSVVFAQNISSLSAGTTYFYCAISQNAEGMAFGSLQSFTTAAAPLAVTSTATSITSTNATLNGTGDPNLAAATGWFRYSTTNPVSCNDTFGTRVPSSSVNDTNLGAGSTAVSYSNAISGLLPGATYFYCAIVQNQFGTAFGSVIQFSTLVAIPVTTTSSATNRTGTSATLNGTANPGGDATTGWFRYATTSPGTCNDSFGTRAPAVSGGSAIPSGNSTVSYSQNISGLTAGTTYFFCAIAQNSVGTGFGSASQFTTPLPPTASTSAATPLTNTTATLNGSGNPNAAATTGWFRYSTTSPGTCNDTFGSRAPVGSGGSSLGSSTSPVSYTQNITSLSPNTTYFYCAIVQSTEGTAFGSIVSFTTPTAPSLTTSAATSVTSSAATLNGSGDPNGDSTTGWFRYSTTSPGTCNDSFGTRAPASSINDTVLGAGSTPVNYANSISSLLPGTTYFYCAIGANTYGTAFGAVQQFTTLAALPVTTTGLTTNRTGTSATLNGAANPGGAATTGWFRYATTSPGTCNDSFGTRAPAVSGGSAIPSGNSTVSYSQNISGLTAGTTYFFCAIAQNSVGTGFGSVSQFTTPLPPTATTNVATSVFDTLATLNGTGNPNGATTTGWFRYAATSPGTCNDTFGTRAPVTGGNSLGAGTSGVTYSQNISGLSATTTYFYCAITQSAEGTAFGSIQQFTTISTVTISGHTVALTGRGIRGATLTLRDQNGVLLQTVISGPVGVYRFTGVQPGRTYTIAVTQRRFTFVPASQAVTPSANIANLDFTGQ